MFCGHVTAVYFILCVLSSGSKVTDTGVEQIEITDVEQKPSEPGVSQNMRVSDEVSTEGNERRIMSECEVTQLKEIAAQNSNALGVQLEVSDGQKVDDSGQQADAQLNDEDRLNTKTQKVHEEEIDQSALEQKQSENLPESQENIAAESMPKTDGDCSKEAPSEDAAERDGLVENSDVSNSCEVKTEEQGPRDANDQLMSSNDFKPQPQHSLSRL